MVKAAFSNEDALKLFMLCCPEIFRNNEIEIFHRFFCPISFIEADVKEYIIDEYDSVELLILRLYAAGIRNADTIHELTGIDVHMIKKLLHAEVYTYGHINPVDGELTNAGKQTIEDNHDINNLFQHALYNVKRELQADALTGTIIRAEAEIPKDRMVPFSDSIEPNILPLEAEKIDEELESEIKERLELYIKEGYLTDGNTLHEIGNLRTREIRYRMVYFVKMKGFRFPFLAMYYLAQRDKKTVRVITPIAIAKEDATKIEYEKRMQEYLVRDNQCFTYLASFSDQFVNCPELSEESIKEIFETEEVGDAVPEQMQKCFLFVNLLKNLIIKRQNELP